MNEDDLIKSTINSYLGNWRNAVHDIDINISWYQGTNRVKLKINNTIEEFSSSCHWFGPYLIFVGTAYYVKFANETTLVFGENEGKGILDDIIWEYQFVRL